MSPTYEALPKDPAPIRVQKFVDHISNHRIHWHENIEILYFIKGENTISFNLQPCHVKEGDIVFFNGKELHTGTIDRRNTIYYCIHVNSNFFHNLVGTEYVVFNTIIRDPRCSALLESAIEQAQNSDFESLIAVRKTMYEFFAILAKDHVSSILSESDYKRQFKRLDTFNAVLEYLDRNFNEDVSVQLLADHFFISPSYFAHLFKSKTGQSVIEYVNGVRIAHAKSFLEKGDLAIGEIAGRVGFGDINYFSRKFKALVGMTPREYQKSCWANKQS